MKCPTCGDEIRNGRCVFCGYRPTEQDIRAQLAWQDQKARISGDSGPEPDPKPKPKRQRSRKPAMPKRLQKPERARQGGPPESRTGKSGGTGPGNPKKQRFGTSGPAPRTAARLFVIAWFLFLIWTVFVVLEGETGLDVPGKILDLVRWLFSAPGS